MFAHPEKKFLGVLRQKARTSLQILGLLETAGFYRHGSPDSIAVASGSAKADGDRIPYAFHYRWQNPDLRCVPVFQDDFESPVAVEVRESKGPAVVAKIQSYHSGNIGEGSISIVREKNISLVAVPGRVGPDEFVHSAPAAFVGRRRGRILRRFCNDLTPEEAGDVSSINAGDIAVCNVQIREAVVIEVPRIRGPGPATHIDSRFHTYILKRAISQISVERVAGHVPPVEIANGFRFFRVKMRIFKHAHAGRDPHSGGVNILLAVVVEIQPASAHPGPRLIHFCFGGNRGKTPVAFVAIKIVAAKIIDYI